MWNVAWSQFRNIAAHLCMEYCFKRTAVHMALANTVHANSVTAYLTSSLRTSFTVVTKDQAVHIHVTLVSRWRGFGAGKQRKKVTVARQHTIATWIPSEWVALLTWRTNKALSMAFGELAKCHRTTSCEKNLRLWEFNDVSDNLFHRFMKFGWSRGPRDDRAFFFSQGRPYPSRRPSATRSPPLPQVRVAPLFHSFRQLIRYLKRGSVNNPVSRTGSTSQDSRSTSRHVQTYVRRNLKWPILSDFNQVWSSSTGRRSPKY